MPRGGKTLPAFFGAANGLAQRRKHSYRQTVEQGVQRPSASGSVTPGSLTPG
jgi:hypothetical protein